MSDKTILRVALKEASDRKIRVDTGLSSKQQKLLRIIVCAATSGRQKAVLAVITTLLLKKLLDPDQDIRQHRKDLPGGFSGRGLDTTTVTPFFREENFPYMQSGSGWLTRSLEQAHSYNENFPGKIKPVKLKLAFLDFVYELENGADTKSCLRYIFYLLLEWRNKNASLVLAKPTGKSIEGIVRLLEQHWNSDGSGTAKLPVLATYAAYICLVNEVARYKNCELLELLSHTSADEKTKRLGDVEVRNHNGSLFEAVEIKHKIRITNTIVNELKEKIAGAGIKTFYILSTEEKVVPHELVKITESILDIQQKYGCQIIVNGVATTLKYYLRLLTDTDRFVYEYASLIERDNEVPFSLKRKWNELME